MICRDELSGSTFPRSAWNNGLNLNAQDCPCRLRRPSRTPRPLGYDPSPQTYEHQNQITKMVKHSLQQSSVPASAPTSPTASRSKSDRNHPATPQRVLQRAHRQLQSSPYSPATSFSTPYTPLSLRSFSTSTASSLATPASSAAQRRLSLSLSPEESFHAKGRKGVPDIAQNWRNRANENGIRVGVSEDSHFDDEGAYMRF